MLELELDLTTKTDEMFSSIQKAGFNVREISRTVAPHGAVEPSDPGSAGMPLICFYINLRSKLLFTQFINACLSYFSFKNKNYFN